jgi:hypothetical protein
MAGGGPDTAGRGAEADKPALGERLARAEQELAKAAEQPSGLGSPEDVPPVIGLDEPKPKRQVSDSEDQDQGSVTGPEEDEAAREIAAGLDSPEPQAEPREEEDRRK